MKNFKLIFSMIFAIILTLLTSTICFADGLDVNTKLLLHMDGSAFKDECGHTIINDGVTLNQTNNKSGFANSASFNGSSSILNVSNSSDFNFGTADFTIDLWMKSNQTSGSWVTLIQEMPKLEQGILSIKTRTASANDLHFSLNDGNQHDYTTGKNVNDGLWHNIALVRCGNNVTLYLDGTSVKSVTYSGSIGFSGESLEIGKNAYDNSYYNGCIDELRISKGIARWTSNFTPTTVPYSPILATDLTLNSKSINMTIGQINTNLTATVSPDNTYNKTVNFLSSNLEVATVDSSTGKITAVGTGVTYITATTQDGSNKQDVCKVTVGNIEILPAGITLNKTTDTINTGNSTQLTAIITPDNVTTTGVIWTSSNSGVATVDGNGKVTAGTATGTTTITATTVNGLSAKCDVTVTAAVIPTPTTGNATLIIDLEDGKVKQYTVDMSVVNDFISWYNNRASGSTGNAYYKFDKSDSIKKTEYVVFEKITSFEVDQTK